MSRALPHAPYTDIHVWGASVCNKKALRRLQGDVWWAFFCSTSNRAAPGSKDLQATGRLKLKVLPSPGTPRLSTWTRPFSLFTILRTMDRPRPWPLARTWFNRVKGVNYHHQRWWLVTALVRVPAGVTGRYFAPAGRVNPDPPGGLSWPVDAHVVSVCPPLQVEASNEQVTTTI